MGSGNGSVSPNLEEAAGKKGARVEKEIQARLRNVLKAKKLLLANASAEIMVEETDSLNTENASLIMIPLLVKERVIGVLEITNDGGFQEVDVSFLEQVADQLAICLENARLYNEVWQRKQEWEITFSAVTDLLIFIDRNCEVQK